MHVPFSIPECCIGGTIEQGSNNLTINVVPDTETCRCPGLKAVAMVETEVERNGKTSRERRFYLSSLPLTPNSSRATSGSTGMSRTI